MKTIICGKWLKATPTSATFCNIELTIADYQAHTKLVGGYLA